MTNDGLFTVLETRVDNLLCIIEQYESDIKLLRSELSVSTKDLSTLKAKLRDYDKVSHDYNFLKKMLAFSIKDNYILSMKNKQTKDKIQSIIAKLDLAMQNKDNKK